ncbi:MAG: tRNA (adenosine(37)-N6)-dimethylallyltransferase MiaA [Ekhidna sp.]|nr:tRNA (adenosine(37)-N6)-dimethylallyltransferase MiaA [Ekhidna sp.]
MTDYSKPLLVSIVGPTAVGKTALAVAIAKWLGVDIVSADSRQFYKEMNIGTAKPSMEELSMVTHHFVNSHSISEDYSAGAYGRDAVDKIEELHRYNSIVIAVGGSGLYLKALWDGFDEMPQVPTEIRKELNEELSTRGLQFLLEELEEKDVDYFNQVDKNNGQRIVRALEVIRATGLPFSSFRRAKTNEMPYRNLKICLSMDRDRLFERINLRMDQMIADGLFEEAESLVSFKDHNALQTVGYSEIFRYLEGAYDKEEAVRLLKRNSRRYAKRQITWFKKYDDIHWFKVDQMEEIKSLISQELP